MLVFDSHLVGPLSWYPLKRLPSVSFRTLLSRRSLWPWRGTVPAGESSGRPRCVSIGGPRVTSHLASEPVFPYLCSQILESPHESIVVEYYSQFPHTCVHPRRFGSLLLATFFILQEPSSFLFQLIHSDPITPVASKGSRGTTA